MKKNRVLNLVLIICISFINYTRSEIFEECEDLEEGTFIIGKQGCKSYIYCDGEESYEGFCPSQLLFNAIDGSCAPEDEVDCSDGSAPAASTEAETAPPATTTTTVATTTTTSATTKIVDGGITQAPSPIDTETSQKEVEFTPAVQTITNAPVTLPSTGGVNPGLTSSPAQICPASDDPHAVILRPSETSCSEYFICYHGTPVRMFCSGQLLFDEVTSKCELPLRVNCKATVQTTPNPKKECLPNTYDYFPYAKNCNYFYKCMNGFLSLQQCPIGFGWSEEMKLCLKLANGRCPLRANDHSQMTYG